MHVPVRGSSLQHRAAQSAPVGTGLNVHVCCQSRPAGQPAGTTSAVKSAVCNACQRQMQGEMDSPTCRHADCTLTHITSHACIPQVKHSGRCSPFSCPRQKAPVQLTLSMPVTLRSCWSSSSPSSNPIQFSLPPRLPGPLAAPAGRDCCAVLVRCCTQLSRAGSGSSSTASPCEQTYVTHSMATDCVDSLDTIGCAGSSAQLVAISAGGHLTCETLPV